MRLHFCGGFRAGGKRIRDRPPRRLRGGVQGLRRRLQRREVLLRRNENRPLRGSKKIFRRRSEVRNREKFPRRLPVCPARIRLRMGGRLFQAQAGIGILLPVGQPLPRGKNLRARLDLLQTRVSPPKAPVLQNGLCGQGACERGHKNRSARKRRARRNLFHTVQADPRKQVPVL